MCNGANRQEEPKRERDAGECVWGRHKNQQWGPFIDWMMILDSSCGKKVCGGGKVQKCEEQPGGYFSPSSDA